MPRTHYRTAAPVLALILGASATHAGSPTISDSIIAGGGGSSNSPGKCFKLDATLGQPMAGYSSGGAFAINVGFLAGRGDRESIFHYGFEECT